MVIVDRSIFVVVVVFCWTVSDWRKAILVGVSSGAFGQFLASPTDLVKVIMQAEGKRKLEGHPPRYLPTIPTNNYNYSIIICRVLNRIKSMNQAFKEIYQQSGVRGLWRGCVVNVQRAALVSLGGLFVCFANFFFLIFIYHLLHEMFFFSLFSSRFNNIRFI